MTTHLLGRHVLDRAENGAGFGDGFAHRRPVADQLGETEIEDLDAPVFRQEDVRRLQIAVNDPNRVRGSEAAGDAERNFDRGGGRERASAKALRERFAIEKLGDQIGAAVLFPCIEHGDHVGVVEASHRLRFGLEALLQGRARPLAGAHDLDRDVAAQPLIVGAVDLAHPSPVHERHDAVAAEPRSRCKRRLGRPRHPLEQRQQRIARVLSRLALAVVTVGPAHPLRLKRHFSPETYRRERPAASACLEAVSSTARSSCAERAVSFPAPHRSPSR